MKTRLCLLSVLVLVAILFVGCKTTPPERIQKAIEIMNAGVTDYVTHCQPLLAERTQALHEQMKKETDPAKKAELEKAIKDEMEFFKLGKEIPPTMQELEDWAKGKPVPEKTDG